MKILYFSCHAILEYDEVKLFHEMGYDIFSAGAYSNPQGHPSLPRPAIDTLHHYKDLERAASTIRAIGGSFPQELIDWADVIIFMHEPEILLKNWDKMKHKQVIFRSIGQCVPHQELILKDLIDQGLKIVRYSPKEHNIPNFAGETAMIRFYKDPYEYNEWYGANPQAITMVQSFKQRGEAVYYNELQNILQTVPNKVYGTTNENLGDQWGGYLSPLQQRQVLKDNRCFIYGGTYPAAYTLSFIEALMTGIPIVALGKEPTINRFNKMDYYEIPDIIANGVNGFVSDDINYLREVTKTLLSDKSLADSISISGRQTAIGLFGKEKIQREWKAFFNTL